MQHPVIDREQDIQQAAQAIKAMAHPLRLRILCLLGNQEVSVQDIVEHVGTSQSNICAIRACWRRAKKRILCITVSMTRAL
jgi:predicted transcriptional regulator